MASPITAPAMDHPGSGVEQAIRYYSHFTSVPPFSTTADLAEWFVSADNGGTNTIADANPNGVLRITPGTSANDYRSMQLNGEAFGLHASRNITIKTRIRTNDADDIKFAVGLFTTASGTLASAGPVLDGVTNSVGFRNVAGNTTTFLSITEDDTTETTNTAGTLADSTWTDLRIDVYGTTKVVFWVNGAVVATHTTNLPDSGDGLTLTFEVGSPTGTPATYLDVDYIDVVASPISVANGG